MLLLSETEIDTAADRCASGLSKYLWLQNRFPRCDVREDETFQRRFNGFYRVRRNAEWRAAYFEIMERAKPTGIEFGEALAALRAKTGRLEASFASKLVATIDPSKPVIDRFVLQNFGLRLPYHYASNREAQILGIYAELCDRYDALLASELGRLICRRFGKRHPNTGISDLKKVDLVLWQHRAPAAV